MGVPLLFSVGACQPNVTFELEAGVVVGGAVVPLPGGVVVPPVGGVVVVAGAVSAMVGGAVALVVLVVDSLPDEPDSSSPHPASATARLPTTAIQTIRPDPNPRSAFCMQPSTDFQCRSGRTRSHNQQVARACSTASALPFSRGGCDRPGNPAVVGFTPLDRKFCAPGFRRVCPYARRVRCQPRARS